MLVLTACSGGDHAGDYIGYVEAEYVYVSAPQSGWLLNAPVRQGDQISPGDVLFELDPTQQEAQLAAARARAEEAGAQATDITRGARPQEIQALEADREEARARLVQAKSEYDRWIPLVREGNASAERGDQVTADYSAARARVNAASEAIEVARLGGREGQQAAAAAGANAMAASLREAQWQFDQRTVRAQVAGRVEEVFHRKGEYVTAAAPILSLLPDDALKVRFFVPQAELERVQPGASVSISADGLSDPISALVSFIASEAEFTPPVIYSVNSREKLVFLVEARLPARAGLHPGLPVDISLP